MQIDSDSESVIPRKTKQASRNRKGKKMQIDSDSDQALQMKIRSISTYFQILAIQRIKEEKEDQMAPKGG